MPASVHLAGLVKDAVTDVQMALMVLDVRASACVQMQPTVTMSVERVFVVLVGQESSVISHVLMVSMARTVN